MICRCKWENKVSTTAIPTNPHLPSAVHSISGAMADGLSLSAAGRWISWQAVSVVVDAGKCTHAIIVHDQWLTRVSKMLSYSLLLERLRVSGRHYMLSWSHSLAFTAPLPLQRRLGKSPSSIEDGASKVHGSDRPASVLGRFNRCNNRFVPNAVMRQMHSC